jgi:calpain
MANLTLNEKIFNTVVPADNSDFDEDYFGIFHFRFWHFGKFIDVVVDDLLPTKDGRQLAYNKSTDENEFWSPLLEKAFAKLYGGYSKIEGGFSHEAFEDFTGGVAEIYDIPYAPVKVYEYIKKAIERNVFFTCSILNSEKATERKKVGLYNAHAYSITGATSLKLNANRTVNLLRIRNPWGQSEWNRAWSDHSPEWRTVPDAEKKRIGLIINDDGEFWMCFEDFKKYFDILCICNVHPDIEMREPNPSRKWNLVTFEEKFSSNLAHEITVTDPDEYDDEDFGTVVVALMQKHARKRHNNKNKAISFKIMSIDGHSFKTTPHCRQNAHYREVCHRYELKPGKYVIEPFMVSRGSDDGEYLLRVFYETKNSAANNVLPQRVARDSDFNDVIRIMSAQVAEKINYQVPKQTPRANTKAKTKSCCNLM